MKTEILDAKLGIEKGAELILRGELVVFPTETVYGLGADAFNESAVRKIFEAKGRPQDNPLIVHISSVEQVKEIAKDIPDSFYEVAVRFMPGPISIVLKKGDKVPYTVTAGGDTVAVRMPSSAIARELIARSKPLAAPSANKSKHISPTTAKHVYDDLNGEVELILDGGSCDVGIESTVLDLTTDTPTVLRPGAVTVEMLAEVLGAVEEKGKVIKIAKSPGMKYTHYAPKVHTGVAKSVESALTEYNKSVAEGGNPVLVYRNIYAELSGKSIIDLGKTPEDYARNIYSALRSAEDKYDEIIIEELHGQGIEFSVMNRVYKSAGNKMV
ncbi:MAG: threonylcarbamoyl-AMP synthase [Clostridia bacterium]|nr:threonylcarbamoyl-AMP synthase [Clostridia bacterium]